MNTCTACNYSLYDDVRGAHNVANCARYSDQPSVDFKSAITSIDYYNASVELGEERVEWAEGLDFSEYHIVQLTPIVEEADRRLSAYEHDIGLDTADLSTWIATFTTLGFDDLAVRVKALLQ